jgi:glucosyl-dolichyl phosphate glucuronosyltransferase
VHLSLAPHDTDRDIRLKEEGLQRLRNCSDHLLRFRRFCGHRQAMPGLAGAWLLANDCTSRRPELVDRNANFSLSDGNAISRAGWMARFSLRNGNWMGGGRRSVAVGSRYCTVGSLADSGPSDHLVFHLDLYLQVLQRPSAGSKTLMEISVIICTRNRAAFLDRVLASAAQMSVPDITWELLIVDNGSGDGVGKVVDRYKARLPVRMERQPEPGLSRARNCGVMSARGKHIIWTDDDVILDQHWLAAYSSAFRLRPEAAVFGGTIVPILDQPCTVWFQQNLDQLWELAATRDFGSEELPLSVADGRVPFGANYAVRAIEQRQFLYDVKLGAGCGTVGEETDVVRAILESGRSGYWVPAATVHHIISAGRQTSEYLVQRYRAQGATKIYLSRRHGREPMSVVMLATRTAVSYIIYIVARAFDLQPFWIKRLKGYAFWLGAMEERLRNR